MNESFGRVIDEFIEEKEYEDEQKKLKELIQSLRVGVAIANIDISASLHQGIFLPSSPKEGPPANSLRLHQKDKQEGRGSKKEGELLLKSLRSKGNYLSGTLQGELPFRGSSIFPSSRFSRYAPRGKLVALSFQLSKQ